MVETYPRLVLDVELLGVVVPLLEQLVEIFLFFCGVVGALVVALCAGLLATELRKDQEMRRRKIQSVVRGGASPNPRSYPLTLYLPRGARRTGCASIVLPHRP